MPPAATIDDVIAFAATDIANISYLVVDSLLTQMNLWIAGMFAAPAGIFPPAANELGNPGQRPVTDWLATHIMARDSIEGPAPGDAGLLSTCACINAVERVAYAVKDATIAGIITGAQQTAVIALYNATWQ